MRPARLLILFLLCSVPLAAQRAGWGEGAANGARNTGEAVGTAFRLMSYNAENFFDTRDDTLRHDDDFLPSGLQRWTPQRFAAKAGRLARVVLDAGGLSPVDVVGLCEVENDSALHFLFHRTRLARLGYRFVVTKGDDVRGMNVAIAWQPQTFRLVGHGSFSVPVEAGERPTRQILLCSGVIPGGDTLDVMMIHFPSRRGGRSADRLRSAAVETVRSVCDSLQRARRNPHIIVMGDCNATPDDRQLAPLRAQGLRYVNPQTSPEMPVAGTYFFRDRWSTLDQVYALGSFPDLQCRILVRDYLTERNSGGVPVPFRTYRGPLYHGGYSDHLPIVTTFAPANPQPKPHTATYYKAE